jgi:integrase/recombinase XerD
MSLRESSGVMAVAWSDSDLASLGKVVAGYLAGFGESTRKAYGLDLRQWIHWCRSHDLRVFEARRAHIELYARWLEERGRARATVARRLSTITGFYRYCVEEELIARSPAMHIRRPKLNYESSAVGLDRNELGMLLVQAGLSGGRDNALACLLAPNGLRISEALNSDIEDLGLERGHRTLTITRKGGKIVTIPLAPRTARAIDLYVGERSEGPIFLNRDGTRRLDRHAATRIVKRLPSTRGSTRRSHRIRCGIRSSPPHSTLASRCGTFKKQHPMLIREPRCGMTERDNLSTGTPHTSSRPS